MKPAQRKDDSARKHVAEAAPGKVRVSDLPKKLVDDELSKGDPRSMEYRQGLLDAVRFRLDGIPIPRRYPAGTVQADAYFAGIERGHALWRMRQQQPEAGRGACS